MITSDQVFFLGKMPTRNGDQGCWHVFTSEDSSESVCRKANQERLHQRLGLRKMDLESGDSLEDVIGLGDLCSSCREYVTGSLSEKELPKPSDGRKRKSNIIKSWKNESKKSATEIYGE